MDSNKQKEQFSNAFVVAVAAAVGCVTGQWNVDEDSVDWQLAQIYEQAASIYLASKKLSGSDSRESGSPKDSGCGGRTGPSGTLVHIE